MSWIDFGNISRLLQKIYQCRECERLHVTKLATDIMKKEVKLFDGEIKLSFIKNGKENKNKKEKKILKQKNQKPEEIKHQCKKESIKNVENLNQSEIIQKNLQIDRSTEVAKDLSEKTKDAITKANQQQNDKKQGADLKSVSMKKMKKVLFQK
jgi:DNA integrity scanning protein DisA with diadenylate cyclase activity